MLDNIVKNGSLLTLSLLFFIVPAHAAMTVISPGNTVFIGEQGLDVSGAVGAATQIGWWVSGASIAQSSPDYTMSMTNPADFFVSPTEFGSRTGSWYILPDKVIAFVVADPQLDIRVEDTTVNIDVTDRWVPTDDELRFRIDTNLVAVIQRGDGAPPVTINVQSPDGAIFTSLRNKAGVTSSIVDIPVTSTPFYTSTIWDTGNRALYPPGNYVIWAECNINRMKDNYDEPGKTTSRRYGLLNQDQNPLITARTMTPDPSTRVTSAAATASPVITPTIHGAQETQHIPAPEPSINLTLPQSPETTTATVPPASTTKTPGFEAPLAGAAFLIILVFSGKR